MVTYDQIVAIMPQAASRAYVFVPYLNEAMDEFGISDTTARQAAFLAQIAHESGSLRYTEEIASGAAYEGRKDLGNVKPGDGKKFKGRGLVQITGRNNYVALSKALYGSADVLINAPERLERADLACISAAWFWKSHGLNELADQGEFEKITRRINGGLNGQKERLTFYERAKNVLKVAEA